MVWWRGGVSRSREATAGEGFRTLLFVHWLPRRSSPVWGRPSGFVVPDPRCVSGAVAALLFPYTTVNCGQVV